MSHDEPLYEKAAEEIMSGKQRRGLWLKAYATALGDAEKTKALYMTLRVAELSEEKKADQTRAQEVRAKSAREAYVSAVAAKREPAKAQADFVVLDEGKCCGPFTLEELLEAL